MRELARKLADSINPAALWSEDFMQRAPVEFQPGNYPFSLGLINVDKSHRIRVQLHQIGIGIAEPHLVKSLYSHLRTSGPKYAQLMGEGGAFDVWASGASQYLENSLKFLKTVVGGVKELNTKINFRDDVKPGLSRWFILTAWKDAMQNTNGHPWIEDSWYQPPENVSGANLWQLRCGAYIIALADGKDALAKYETLHKQLRAGFAERSMVKNIAADYNKLDEIARDVKQRLLEFNDEECLLGYCDLDKHE
jgi:hypothetical protein